MTAPTRKEPQEGGPILVKVGRATVRIYPRAAERGRSAGFVLADYSTGKRRQRWFTDLKEAKKEAARICTLTNAGDVEGAAMTGEDRRQLLRATELVAPFNLDVATACELFAAAARKVGPHSVVPAATEYAKRHPASRERVPIAKAADDFYEMKAAKKVSDRHLSGIRSILGRFVQEHPGKAVSEFLTADIQRWLDKLRISGGAPASAQTRKNFAAVLGIFFEWSRRRGTIAENPCRDLEKETAESDGDVEFWSPEEAEALLKAAEPILAPSLAIALFAGVRSAEVCRLTWRAVDFDQGHIEIGKKGAKTRSRRLAPMTDNLRAWLLPYRGNPDAPIFTEHCDGFPKRTTEAAERAGVRRIANGARHSFITFRTALTGDVSRTALEAGNSPSVIFGHYRGLATAEQAKRYFGIQPTTEADNVIPLSASA
ncbi:MAG: site-specific integrase [Verrucomicrobiota bacterium]